LLRSLTIECHDDVLRLKRAEQRNERGARTGSPASSAGEDKDHETKSGEGSPDSEQDEMNQLDQAWAVQTGSTGYATSQTSAMLLQMVPYRSRSSYSTTTRTSQRFLTEGENTPDSPDTELSDSVGEASRSARLLLDKWTTPGSLPVAKILGEANNDIFAKP
jgi:hypothetical protein